MGGRRKKKGHRRGEIRWTDDTGSVDAKRRGGRSKVGCADREHGGKEEQRGKRRAGRTKADRGEVTRVDDTMETTLTARAIKTVQRTG
jgi:hypothetical protein